jgi:selenocysteine lyase/cysteine desulfurase
MIYFDNASTTWPKPIIATPEQYVNAGRGQYTAAAKAGALLAETRAEMKNLLYCNANYETIFTSSATEALNTILQGLDYSKVRTVYITPLEHNAVLRTIFFLQKKWKFGIIHLIVQKQQLGYDLAAIERQFVRKPPGLVVMSHASNMCGLVAPIGELCALARKHNAITVIDMAQTAGLLDTNLTDWGVGAAVFAGHKTLYAPFGAAGFVVRKDLPLSPLLYGGTGLHSATAEMPAELPARFEAGSRNYRPLPGCNNPLSGCGKRAFRPFIRKSKP